MTNNKNINYATPDIEKLQLSTWTKLIKICAISHTTKKEGRIYYAITKI